MKSGENEIEPTAMRACAAMLAAEGYTNAADYFRRKADELDPPEPDIPDGHVWYRYSGKTPQDWIPGLKRGVKIVNQYGQQVPPDSRLEVVPSRILEPGQVAVDRKAIEWAANLLRSELYTFAADRLQAALDRDTEAER